MNTMKTELFWNCEW